MPEMTLEERACCACLTVKYDAQLVDSRTQTYAECWKCVDCGTMFWKKAHMDQAIHEAEAPLREENQRLRAALEAIPCGCTPLLKTCPRCKVPLEVRPTESKCPDCGGSDFDRTALECERCQALTASSSALTERDSRMRDEGSKEHGRHVQQFLNDLYAIMVDPLAEGTQTVTETCQQLLEAAKRDRERWNTEDDRDTRMKREGAREALMEAQEDAQGESYKEERYWWAKWLRDRAEKLEA